MLHYGTLTRKIGKTVTKTIVDRVMSQAGDGRTILIHDIYRTSGDAADEIMKKLTDQSYQLTTVSQLEEVKNKEKQISRKRRPYGQPFSI